MKNKYLHRLGCFVLAGSMMLTSVPVTYAAETEMQTAAGSLTEAEEETSQTETVMTETNAPETDQPETDQTETETSTPDTPAETETPVFDETETPQSGQTDETRDSSEDPDSTNSKGNTADISDNKKVTDIEDGEKEIKKPDDETVQIDHSDAASDYTSNIIAGNTVYLSELFSEYGLSFSDEFEKVMDKIEEDYQAFLDDPDAFTAENWQDVLAVYVMKYASDEKTVTMDKSCRDELEQIFFLMNVRSNSAILRKLQKVQGETINDTEETQEDTEEPETTQQSENTGAGTATGVRSNRKASADTVQQDTTVEHTANIKKAADEDKKETVSQKEEQEKEY